MSEDAFGDWAVEVDGIRYPQAHRMNARRIAQECMRYDIPVEVYHKGKPVVVFSFSKNGLLYATVRDRTYTVRYKDAPK